MRRSRVSRSDIFAILFLNLHSQSSVILTPASDTLATMSTSAPTLSPSPSSSVPHQEPISSQT